MTDIEDAAATIADELGLDLPYLQPPEETRFDPATLAVVVGLWLLHNVADGIAEGIKAQAQEGTQALLRKIGELIRRKARGSVERTMASASGDIELDQTKAKAESVLSTARAALADQPGDVRTVVLDTAARAAADSLAESGLPAASTERMYHVIRIEVRALLTGQES